MVIGGSARWPSSCNDSSGFRARSRPVASRRSGTPAGGSASSAWTRRVVVAAAWEARSRLASCSAPLTGASPVPRRRSGVHACAARGAPIRPSTARTSAWSRTTTRSPWVPGRVSAATPRRRAAPVSAIAVSGDGQISSSPARPRPPSAPAARNAARQAPARTASSPATTDGGSPRTQRPVPSHSRVRRASSGTRATMRSDSDDGRTTGISNRSVICRARRSAERAHPVGTSSTGTDAAPTVWPSVPAQANRSVVATSARPMSARAGRCRNSSSRTSGVSTCSSFGSDRRAPPVPARAPGTGGRRPGRGGTAGPGRTALAGATRLGPTGGARRAPDRRRHTRTTTRRRGRGGRARPPRRPGDPVRPARHPGRPVVGRPPCVMNSAARPGHGMPAGSDRVRGGLGSLPPGSAPERARRRHGAARQPSSTEVDR
ncbi:hypothetical protein Ae505Ps2_5797 [Pseudonocardia sp. Ae505_Ps2]|nr:hypothetical protein Ae505Ps2_5797 [Pseudonocardia sp. Ae505_Ps2]